MQHYVSTKRTLRKHLANAPHQGFILLYRVGDFFESFFEDAHVLSRVLEIALTSKDAGKSLCKRVPMAGIPHHCLQENLRVLLEHSITVGVVDQVQPTSPSRPGKLVDRVVTRLITPGTACDESLMDSGTTSYLASIIIESSEGKQHSTNMGTSGWKSEMDIRFGFAYADVSTGEFKATQSSGLDALRRLLVSLSPTELLLVIPSSWETVDITIEQEIRNLGIEAVSRRKLLPLRTCQEILCSFHGVDDVESLGCRSKPLCIQAAGVLLSFVEKTMGFEGVGRDSLLLNKLSTFSVSESMSLDGACLRNLEVLRTARDGVKSRSLQWAVDRTETVMGTRCLRSWLLNPPLSLDTIVQRQLVIEALVKDGGAGVREIQLLLRTVSDLERFGGRLILQRTTPRELQTLCKSIVQVPGALKTLEECIREHLPVEHKSGSLDSLLSPVDGIVLNLSQKILSALVDSAPAILPSGVSAQGSASIEQFTAYNTQIFRRGYNQALDELRDRLGCPERWISKVEKREKARTGIDSLRIKHVKNTGYVVRVPRTTGEKILNEDAMFFKRLRYEQVQSTKAELRFRFDDLCSNEKEFNVGLSQIVTLELSMYEELRDQMRNHVPYMRALGYQVAQVDVLVGLAKVALEQNYVKPVMLPGSHRVLELVDIRHPVVEQTMPRGKSYVPNSFRLGNGDGSDSPDLMIVCGPNAAGKSCSLRSVGLVAILGQMGSFVPARSATMSISDRIFTRVGAVDDLSQGQSTFQVEMAETSCILSHATSSSLVLLDEIGRGTSSVDGIALAWSISEFLAVQWRGGPPPRSMFVTHYHELNHLSEMHGNVRSFHLHVQSDINNRQQWTATYSVVDGPCYDSSGIAIAERAGLPQAVIQRAQSVAELLRVPSQKIGAALREGLDASKEKSEAARNGCAKALEDICEENDTGTSYKSGYEDGYRAALAEVRASFERTMSTCSERLDKAK